MKKLHWVTTSPNPRSRATGYDAGQRGWKLHAIWAKEAAKFSDIRWEAALCGVRGKHGWSLDLFIEDRCLRCAEAIKRARLKLPD